MPALQLKIPVDLKIHIDINKHVDVISVVQKTVSRDRQDIAADIQVYAQKVRLAIQSSEVETPVSLTSSELPSTYNQMG